MTKSNACLRLAEDDGARPCRTAADVWAKAAHVRTFRIEMWPSQRPAAPTAPVLVLPALPAVRGRIAVRRVLEVTADHFGTTVADLIGRSRKQPLCRRRQLAMYIAHKITGRGLPFIGNLMGGRDHTTILHGERVVQGLIDAGDGETIAAVNQIVERLQIAGGAHD